MAATHLSGASLRQRNHPSVKAAWEHDFTSNAWTVNASFAPVTSLASFGINGAALSRDAAFVDAG
jgi:uncharacterized protein with beta-barrel porin domain